MAVKSLCHVSFGPNSWLVAEYVYLLLRIIINHIHNGHKNILSTSLPRTSNSNGEGRALKRGGYVYVCPCIRCTISLSLNHQCSFGLLWWHPVVLWEIYRQFCGYTEPPCIITYALTYTTHSTGPSCPRCVWSDIIQRLPTNR